jgi:hypothetical protein
MLFMVIEHFKETGAAPVYKRFAEQGRMSPEGLKYVGSWTEADLNRCFQLMECEDASLFQEWVSNWSDLVDFVIVPVVPSVDTVRVFGFAT